MVPPTVGILAIQGDFEKHRSALRDCGLDDSQIVLAKTPEQIQTLDALIIPGGESSTVGLLLQRYGTGQAIRNRAASGMPIWGTCMGMILLANEVENRTQYSLNLLDITVRRNAFGAQVHSFERPVPFADEPESVLGVFIRAPIVTRWGLEVEPISVIDDKVVAVRQGNILGTSFHPELTEDRRVHEYFLRSV